MNNRNLKITLVVIALLVITIVAIWFIPQKNIDYVIIENGYSSYDSKIISNYQEYLEFIDYIDSQDKAYGENNKFDFNKYNKEYFDNKSLAIINIVTGSSMNKLKNIDISVIGNLLICDVDIKYANGIVSTDINGKLLLVEINKSVTKLKIK